MAAAWRLSPPGGRAGFVLHTATNLASFGGQLVQTSLSNEEEEQLRAALKAAKGEAAAQEEASKEA